MPATERAFLLLRTARARQLPSHPRANREGGAMMDHTPEPPEPTVPEPKPEDVPQPDQEEVKLPPKEKPQPLQVGEEPGASGPVR
jgi:hypothetical protein